VKHEAKADATPILATSAEDWEVEVVDVQARAHVGRKGIPMLVVDYFDAVGTRHREFVCLQHDGYALAKARRWWERRFGLPVPATVDEALGRELYLAHSIKEMTPTIVSRWAPNGGRDVVDCKLRNDAVKAMAR